MRLTKYHGLGNDFIIADLRSGNDPEGIQDPAAVRRVCDRHFGVGGDGVLAVLPATTPGAHARMRVLNADGGEAEMCGNGIRCVAVYLRDRDDTLAVPELVIDTGAGPLTCALIRDENQVQSVTVDMGPAYLLRGDIPVVGPPGERCVEQPLPAGRELLMTCVGTGNPHAVAFVDETGPELLELARTCGPEVENHEWFPERTNAEFVRVHSRTHLEMVVWERGCGITLACGTGACATVVAAILTGRADPDTDVTVQLLGGDLSIRVVPDFSAMYMTGPATHVFDFDLDIAALRSA